MEYVWLEAQSAVAFSLFNGGDDFPVSHSGHNLFTRGDTGNGAYYLSSLRGSNTVAPCQHLQGAHCIEAARQLGNAAFVPDQTHASALL